MNYILLSFLVSVPGILSSTSESRSNLDSSAEITSLSKLAAAVSKLRKHKQDGTSPEKQPETKEDDRIDLDYFGFRQFDSEPEAEEDRFKSDNPLRPRLVYISNPQVLKDYQKKLGHTHARSPETASLDNDDLDDLNIKDILEFLVQVEARIEESEGRTRTANKHQSVSFSKLEKIIQNLRRQNEDMFDSFEGHPGAGSYMSDAKKFTRQVIKSEADSSSEERVRTTKRSYKENRESIAQSPVGRMRVKSRSKELSNPFKRNSLKKRELSEELISRPKKTIIPVNKDRFRPKRVANRMPGFIGTPIPLRGKKSIYED